MGRLPSVKAFLFIFITFFIVLPPLLVHTQYSLYFSQSSSDVTDSGLKQRNSDRIKRSEKQLKDELQRIRNASSLQKMTGSSRADVVVTVVTMDRSRLVADDFQPKYLTQVALRLLELKRNFEQLSLKERLESRTTFELRICNVDRHVEVFHEAKNLTPVFQQFVRFPAFQSQTTSIIHEHILEREKQDYVFCLNQSLHLKPSHVLLVEDDALPLDNLFPVVDHVIRKREQLMYSQSQRVSFFKLFHPYRLRLYFLPDVPLLLELLGASLVFGSIAFQIHRYLILPRVSSIGFGSPGLCTSCLSAL